MKWKLKGGHKQKTRSGYNFWKPFTSQTKNGVTLTVKDDGSYVLSGTATQITSFYVNGLNYDAADYTIALFNSTAISNEGFYVQVEHENGLLKQAFLTTNTIKSGTTGKVNALSIVIPADLTLNNFTFKPMLLKGIYTANTMPRFEQYGMMPSKDYPSEIETVGSNVNLFDKDNVNKLNAVPDVSSIVVNSSGKSFYIKVKSDTAYTISRKIVGSRFVVGTTANLPAAGETIIDRKVNNEGSSITLTTSKNVNYLVVYYLYNSSENEEEILDNIKIEKGSVATPYSSCGMGSAEVDVVNKTLLNIANTEKTTKGGITYSIKNGILKLNGTATASFDIQLSKNIKRKKGKYTHSSSYIQSGLYISFDNLGYTMISSTVGNKKTFEITKDTTYKTYFIWIDKGTVLSNVEIKLQLEVGDTATDFVEHQSQTAIMPVQQEMLQGDYIEDVEHHEWGKIIITGEENWVAESVGRFSIGKEIYISRPKTPPTNDDYVGNLCNCYAEKTPTLTWNKKQGFCVTKSGDYLAIYDNTYSPNSDVNGFKACLKSKYDANDPVVIYYKLANAIDLELTEAQKAVREQKLHTYKNITNINLSDELASIDVTYKKDLDTILNNLQAQIIANASEEVTE